MTIAVLSVLFMAEAIEFSPPTRAKLPPSEVVQETLPPFNKGHSVVGDAEACFDDGGGGGGEAEGGCHTDAK